MPRLAVAVIVIVAAVGCKKDAAPAAAGSGEAMTTPTPAPGSGSATPTPTPTPVPTPTTGAPAAFVGSWKLDGVTTKDGPVAKDKLDKGAMTWVFKPDGTMDMMVEADGKSVTAKATWSQAGDTITIDENGQLNKVTFKRDGTTLVLAATASSVVMTFKLMRGE